MDYKLTENREEIIEIGKQIADEQVGIFTPKLIDKVLKIFRQFYAEEDVFPFLYSAVYHLWMYGTSIPEYFMFDFGNRSHEEKLTYVTWYTRFVYMAFLNRERDKHLLDNKFEAYNILKPYYKREAILVSDESDFSAFCDFVKIHKSIYVKPVNMGLAVGVHRLCVDATTDLHTVFDSLLAEVRSLESFMVSREIERALIIEEEIIPSNEIARFNPSDMSILRVTTVTVKGKVNFFYPAFRIMCGDGESESGETYSIDALIDAETGTVCTNGINELNMDCEYHPTTGVKINGYQMPEWDSLKNMLTEAAGKFPTIRYIGWDVVHTDNGWCIIEGNTNGEFFAQMLTGYGFKDEFEKLIGFSVPEKYRSEMLKKTFERIAE